jgi:hypothetical protein
MSSWTESLTSGLKASVKAVSTVVSLTSLIKNSSGKAIGTKTATKLVAEKKAADIQSSAGGGGSSSSGGSSGGGSTVFTPTMNTPTIQTDLITWGDYSFFIKPTAIRSYRDLSIQSSCSTEEEENGDDGYLKKKRSGAFIISLTAILDKRLGEDDVKAYAMRLAESARSGASAWIYNNGSKMAVGIMMGTSANINNIVAAPNGMWISSEVQLTLKQCTKLDGTLTPPPPPPPEPEPDDGGSSGSGGGGSSSSLDATQAARSKSRSNSGTPTWAKKAAAAAAATAKKAASTISIVAKAASSIASRISAVKAAAK